MMNTVLCQDDVSAFKLIRSIADVKDFVEDKKEIKFLSQPRGITLGCYLFMDSKTFDSKESVECRGIAFDSNGNVISRPLHKFFNVGEKDYLFPDALISRNDVAAVFEKLDGSMIATAFHNGELLWRSKKAFNSDVVKLARQHIADEAHQEIEEFSIKVASSGMTAIFELTHPQARIVVPQEKPAMRLLHVRDNLTGAYVMLDKAHEIHSWIDQHNIELVKRYEGLTVSDVLESLANMHNQEGYVIQFNNGDMVKVKCPWYVRLHRSITFLRERDIASLALNEELDDVKSALVEAGIDLTAVNEVESRLKNNLLSIYDEIEGIYQAGMQLGLDRKNFAITYSNLPLFGLAMQRYLGKEVSLNDWYIRNRLKVDFGLRTLANDTLAEAMEG